jgi:hypothetical protein
VLATDLDPEAGESPVDGARSALVVPVENACVLRVVAADPGRFDPPFAQKKRCRASARPQK